MNTNENIRARSIFKAVKDYLKNSKSILDVFCGCSPLYPYFAHKAFYGLDNKQIINELKIKHPNGHWYADKFDKPIKIDAFLYLNVTSEINENLIIKYSPKVIVAEAQYCNLNNINITDYKLMLDSKFNIEDTERNIKVYERE
jgi:hypothetical protein